MKQLLLGLQVTSSLLLIAAILVQNKGVGLGGVFGGGDSNVYRTRRGAEKAIFRATIILAAIFLLTGLASLFLK
jgi:preprotein translocase subunit SecG